MPFLYPKRGRSIVFLLLCFLALDVPSVWADDTATTTNGTPPRLLSLVLAPGGIGTDHAYIDVTMTLSGVHTDPGAPFLHVAQMLASEPGVSYTADDLQATDDIGPLLFAMSAETGSHSGFQQERYFTARRASTGNITVRYRATAPPVGAPRHSGPPFDLRGEGGGISGAGSCFLILPNGPLPFHITLRWDLSHLPSGGRAVSSLGLGDVTLDGAMDRLEDSYFLAGDLHSAQPHAGHLPFNGFWLGQPHFDAAALTTWAAIDYAALQQFFHGYIAPPFFMFVRPGSIPASGGAALPNSFLLSAGTQAEPTIQTKLVLAHELLHPWVEVLDEGAGDYAWYGEGFAEYYMVWMPARAGLINDHVFITKVNTMVADYYKNPDNRLPNSRIGARFWSSPTVRRLPYSRGFVYLTLVDSQIRAASRGKRSLDNILAAMLTSKRAGKGYSERTWRALVGKELGQDRAERDFQAMTSGQLLHLPEDAFGPHFTRMPTKTGLDRWIVKPQGR